MDPDIDLLVTDGSGSDDQTGSDGDVAVGNVPNAERKRGVKRGTRRGHYKRTGDEKARVLAAYDGAGDWRAVAKANGVSTSTAYGWIRRADAPEKRGARSRKLSENDVDKLLSFLEENPLLSLKELGQKLLEETGVRVCTIEMPDFITTLPACR